ncbi:MAG: SLC13 family permease [Verrucomicrobia bacterium]|nr:SLC13 family permease [Verrucomicrobiota bacterium]
MEIALAIAVVVGAGWLFVTERFPAALVAMMALTACLLLALVIPLIPWMRESHWITLNEGVSGFSSPATITVAAMFVLSAGLQYTGAIAWLGPGLAQVVGGRYLLLVVLMLTIAVISAFVNNTAAVAVLLPIVLNLCARQGTPPSRFLIPLSYAAQFGGVCTLVGTSTNLLVSSISARAGHGSFGLFEFLPLGAILAATGVAYLAIVSRWLIPDRPGRGGVQSYQVAEYVTELRLPAASPLVGRTVSESGFGRAQGARLLIVLRTGKALWPNPGMVLQAADILLVESPAAELIPLRKTWRLESEPEFRFGDETLRGQPVRLAEVVLAPSSRLVGRTLEEVDFRRQYRCLVVGLRSREPVRVERLATARLGPGDAMLLLGPNEEIDRLRGDPEFLVLDRVAEPALRRTKVPLALAIFVSVVALAAMGVVPILPAALSGCIALVATRCLSLEEACEAIDWKVIFLLAGVLPLGLVLEKSGAATLLAEGALTLSRPFGPLGALAILYLVTAILTEFMSNGATAVLLAPIALALADSLGISSRPLLMAVCFAASTSFCTPVGYQTNAMVQHPGGYRFADYLRVGLPLNLTFWVLCVWLIPRFWPF